MLKKGAIGGLKNAAKIGAVLTAGAISPGLGIGVAVALYANKKLHLQSGFRAGLKSWRQKSDQSLSLKAKLLKFRNAVSMGYRQAQSERQQEKAAKKILSTPMHLDYLKQQGKGW